MLILKIQVMLICMHAHHESQPKAFLAAAPSASYCATHSIQHGVKHSETIRLGSVPLLLLLQANSSALQTYLQADASASRCFRERMPPIEGKTHSRPTRNSLHQHRVLPARDPLPSACQQLGLALAPCFRRC